MIPYIRNLKTLPGNRADKHFQQNGGYKINTLKSLSFSYTKDKYTGKEVREAISFIIVSNQPPWNNSNQGGVFQCGDFQGRG